LCYGFDVTEQISQRELRNDSGRIMRALDEGESFVITRNGTPVGELLPLRRHRFVAASTVVAMFRDAPPIDAAALRNDLDEIVQQEVPDRA
jgi:prevent-host-death family protein